MIDNIRHMFVGITIAVWAFLKPIEGDLLSLIIVFFLNFFFGYLSGLIANREDFELKKALRCIAEATIFFVLCCAIYTIGNLKHQPEGALQCVSFVTYVVLWFYTLNILKNLKKMFKRDTTPWLIVSFLYYILRFKFIERIPAWQSICRLGVTNYKVYEYEIYPFPLRHPCLDVPGRMLHVQAGGCRACGQ